MVVCSVDLLYMSAHSIGIMRQIADHVRVCSVCHASVCKDWVVHASGQHRLMLRMVCMLVFAMACSFDSVLQPRVSDCRVSTRDVAPPWASLA